MESRFGFGRTLGDENSGALVGFPIQGLHHGNPFVDEAIEVHDEGTEIERHVVGRHPHVVERMLVLERMTAAAKHLAGCIELIDVEHRLSG